MIDQDLYILILEMFDDLKKEEDILKYLEFKNMCLNNKELTYLIRKYQEQQELLESIQDSKYQEDILKEIDNLNNKIYSIDEYQEYLKYTTICEQRLKELSKIIFKDIVEVVEGGCHACS